MYLKTDLMMSDFGYSIAYRRASNNSENFSPPNKKSKVVASASLSHPP